MDELARWVAENCKPGSRWRWIGGTKWMDVILVLRGYKTNKPGDPYYIEIEAFFLVGATQLHKSLPHGQAKLPRELTELIKAHSKYSPHPYHIDSDAFKSLVDLGKFVLEKDK